MDGGLLIVSIFISKTYFNATAVKDLNRFYTWNNFDMGL